MPLETIDSFTQGKQTARLINAAPNAKAKIINGAGDKLFYKTAADVDTGDTEVAVGSSATVEQVVWIVSEGRSQVLVEHPLSIVAGSSTVTGVTTATGGIASTGLSGLYTWQPATAETGTDTAFAEKKLFTAGVFLPANKTLTGIGYLLGAGGGTNKVIAALFDSTGTKVANSSETTEGTVAGTEKTVQELAFTSTYAAKGPALYFIGITANGATAKLRTIPANTAGKNIFTKEISLSEKNVVPASITAPTAFEAAKGPIAFCY